MFGGLSVVLQFFAAIVLSGVVGSIGGCVYGSHTERTAQEAKHAKQFQKAVTDKEDAEKANRELNAKIGVLKREKDNAIDAAIDAVGNGGLRASICVPAANPPAGTGTRVNDGRAERQRFVARNVDLADVEREIKQLAKERDKCAAKVEGLQATINGYTADHAAADNH